jgi:hypothetical protein
VGVLVICVLVFTAFCIVCTVFFVLFHLCICLCMYILVQGLLPPGENLTAVVNNNNNNNVTQISCSRVLRKASRHVPNYTSSSARKRLSPASPQ